MKKVWFLTAISLLAVFLVAIPSTSFSALEETGGIGLTVAQLYDETTKDHKGYLVVLNVLKDGPADNGGVEKGDIITHINGKITKGRVLEDFLRTEIRGPEGKEVFLKIWRYSLAKRLEIKLIRVPMFY